MSNILEFVEKHTPKGMVRAAAKKESEKKEDSLMDKLFEYEKCPDGTFVIKKIKQKNMAEVNVPSGVKKIADGAFKGSDCLKVNLPKGLMEIGDGAFKNCSKLISINIPQTVMAIGKEAFYGDSELSLKIPSSVKMIGQDALYGTKLHKKNLPAVRNDKVKPQKVKTAGEHKNMGKAFLGFLQILVIIVSIACVAFLFMGILRYDHLSLVLRKVGFYLSFILLAVEILLAVKKRVGNITIVSIVVSGAAALVAIFSSFSGFLTVQDYVNDSEAGFIYAKHNNNKYDIVKVLTTEDELVLDGETGIKISKVKKGAFKGNDTIVSVTFKNMSSLIIQRNAFKNSTLKTLTLENCSKTTFNTKFLNRCDSLEKVELKSGVYKARMYAFKKCETMKEFILRDCVFNTSHWKNKNEKSGYVFGKDFSATIYIYSSTFNELCDEVKEVVVDGNSTLNVFSSKGNHKITNLIYLEGVTNVTGSRLVQTVFKRYFPIAENVYLPSSVSYISESFFGSEYKTYNLYYQGSESQWSGISIGSKNNNNIKDRLFDVNEIKFHYNSTNDYWS